MAGDGAGGAWRDASLLISSPQTHLSSHVYRPVPVHPSLRGSLHSRHHGRFAYGTRAASGSSQHFDSLGSRCSQQSRRGRRSFMSRRQAAQGHEMSARHRDSRLPSAVNLQEAGKPWPGRPFAHVRFAICVIILAVLEHADGWHTMTPINKQIKCISPTL